MTTNTPNEDTKQRRNPHEPYIRYGRCVVLYKVPPYHKHQNEDPPKEPPPQGMTTPPPHGNQQRDPPKRVPNETRRTEEWYHTPAQAGRYHTPAHAGECSTCKWVTRKPA
ncbi:hypothetical protein BS47DRAFT_1358686 [Hydnum rufescens UP504]|uniref:Uncharacterized protein n=1 Tax=Hydnum rufescens UP504 TaxID=1448309 RepID=A0A9P6B7T9_9AGAM|nr:hypothetical protein BS47DRAFT_1358686 [Hydnum rufescens UP504]